MQKDPSSWHVLSRLLTEHFGTGIDQCRILRVSAGLQPFFRQLEEASCSPQTALVGYVDADASEFHRKYRLIINRLLGKDIAAMLPISAYGQAQLPEHLRKEVITNSLLGKRPFTDIIPEDSRFGELLNSAQLAKISEQPEFDPKEQDAIQGFLCNPILSEHFIKLADTQHSAAIGMCRAYLWNVLYAKDWSMADRCEEMLPFALSATPLGLQKDTNTMLFLTR